MQTLALGNYGTVEMNLTESVNIDGGMLPLTVLYDCSLWQELYNRNGDERVYQLANKLGCPGTENNPDY